MYTFVNTDGLLESNDVYFNLDTVNRRDKKGENIEHLRGRLVEST